jgi:hypothetical protein
MTYVRPDCEFVADTQILKSWRLQTEVIQINGFHPRRTNQCTTHMRVSVPRKCMILWQIYAEQGEGIQITKTKRFESLDKTEPNTENISIVEKDRAKHREYFYHWTRRSQTHKMFLSLDKTEPNTYNIPIIGQDGAKHRKFSDHWTSRGNTQKIFRSLDKTKPNAKNIRGLNWWRSTLRAIKRSGVSGTVGGGGV